MFKLVKFQSLNGGLRGQNGAMTGRIHTSSFQSSSISRGFKTMVFSHTDGVKVMKDRSDLEFSVFKTHFDRSVANFLLPHWNELTEMRRKEKRMISKEDMKIKAEHRKKVNETRKKEDETPKRYFLQDPNASPFDPVEVEEIAQSFKEVSVDDLPGVGLKNPEFTEFSAESQYDLQRIETEQTYTTRQVVEKIKHQMVESGIVPKEPLYLLPEDSKWISDLEDHFYVPGVDIEQLEPPKAISHTPQGNLNIETAMVFIRHHWPSNQAYARRVLRERKVVLKVKMEYLGLSSPAFERFKELVVDRYDNEKDILTLVGDLFETKSDNVYLIKRRLKSILEESWKADPNFIPFKLDEILPIDFDPKYPVLKRNEMYNVYDPAELREVQMEKDKEARKQLEEDRKITIFRISPALLSQNLFTHQNSSS